MGTECCRPPRWPHREHVVSHRAPSRLPCWGGGVRVNSAAFVIHAPQCPTPAPLRSWGLLGFVVSAGVRVVLCTVCGYFCFTKVLCFVIFLFRSSMNPVFDSEPRLTSVASDIFHSFTPPPQTRGRGVCVCGESL